MKFHVRSPRAASRAPRARVPHFSTRAGMDRPKRARVTVDYAESESEASDSESESEAFDPDEGSDDASEDDDYEDDDVEESEEDEPVEEDEDDDDILVIDDEDDDVIDLEEWDPESIRQHVMLEFNQAYASFGDFTSQDTRDAFRWIWNIERGERLVPVAELVSDSTLVQEHVSALGKELESAMDGPEGDYLLKATELQERHREFLHSGIVKETLLLATDIGIRYDARKLSEHGGIPHAYRCRRVVCELFAAFLVRVIPGNVRAQRRVLGDLPPGVADPVAERIAPAVSAADIWGHIKDDMNSLDVDRYIRRCIGGAVAMLTLARREHRMPSWYDRWFEPNHYTRFARPTGAGGPHHHRIQVLGASRTADVADGNCRLTVYVVDPSRSDVNCGRFPAKICVHAPCDTPLMSVLDVARERYADVRAFFSQNGGIPQLFFASGDQYTGYWGGFLVRAAIGTVRDWDTSTFIAVYDVPEDTHTCEVPFASLFLERRYPSDQQIQSISLKFETAIRNNNFLQRFVGQDDVNGPVDEEKVKEKLRAYWESGRKLTLDASLATWRDHVQAPRSYQLLNLNAKRNTPFPKTDKAYAKLRERLQSVIDRKVALLSEFWKRWTLNRLHSLVDSIDPRWGIRPGNRFQRFCYAMSDVHGIEITSQRIPIELTITVKWLSGEITTIKALSNEIVRHFNTNARLKANVQTHYDDSYRDQGYLIHNGEPVDKDKTLDDVGIRDGDTVCWLLAKGGPDSKRLREANAI